MDRVSINTPLSIELISQHYSSETLASTLNKVLSIFHTSLPALQLSSSFKQICTISMASSNELQGYVGDYNWRIDEVTHTIYSDIRMLDSVPYEQQIGTLMHEISHAIQTQVTDGVSPPWSRREGLAEMVELKLLKREQVYCREVKKRIESGKLSSEYEAISTNADYTEAPIIMEYFINHFPGLTESYLICVRKSRLGLQACRNNYNGCNNIPKEKCDRTFEICQENNSPSQICNFNYRECLKDLDSRRQNRAKYCIDELERCEGVITAECEDLLAQNYNAHQFEEFLKQDCHSDKLSPVRTDAPDTTIKNIKAKSTTKSTTQEPPTVKTMSASKAHTTSKYPTPSKYPAPTKLTTSEHTSMPPPTDYHLKLITHTTGKANLATTIRLIPIATSILSTGEIIGIVIAGATLLFLVGMIIYGGYKGRQNHKKSPDTIPKNGSDAHKSCGSKQKKENLTKYNKHSSKDKIKVAPKYQAAASNNNEEEGNPVSVKVKEGERKKKIYKALLPPIHLDNNPQLSKESKESKDSTKKVPAQNSVVAVQLEESSSHNTLAEEDDDYVVGCQEVVEDMTVALGGAIDVA